LSLVRPQGPASPVVSGSQIDVRAEEASPVRHRPGTNTLYLDDPDDANSLRPVYSRLPSAEPPTDEFLRVAINRGRGRKNSARSTRFNPARPGGHWRWSKRTRRGVTATGARAKGREGHIARLTFACSITGGARGGGRPRDPRRRHGGHSTRPMEAAIGPGPMFGLFFFFPGLLVESNARGRPWTPARSSFRAHCCPAAAARRVLGSRTRAEGAGRPLADARRNFYAARPRRFPVRVFVSAAQTREGKI